MSLRTIPLFSIRSAAVLTLVISAMALGDRVVADVPFNSADADSFRLKLESINRNSTAAARAARETPVREGELNAYLRYQAGDQIPVGVAEPYITIMGGGRVAGRAIVDLDVVRRTRTSSGWFDPMRFLTGRLPVAAQGVLHTQAGVARLQIDSLEVAGVGMPRSILQELVSFYTRTPEDPDGVSLEDPFALPAQIREIRVGAGEAIVVQ